MPKIATADLTARMLSDFCCKKLSTVLAPREVELCRDSTNANGLHTMDAG